MAWAGLNAKASRLRRKVARLLDVPRLTPSIR